MKKFLLIAVMALTVLACNREEVPVDTENLTGQLTVSIAGDDSKATGTLPTDVAESTINSLDVFIFSGDLLITTHNFTAEELTAKVSKFTVKTGEVDIYVVANAAAGTFTDVISKTGFYAAKATLSQTSTALPMVSETLKKTLAVGENKLDAKVERLVARVHIESITMAPTVSAATFVPSKVYMMNAMAKSTFGSTTALGLITSDVSYGSKGIKDIPGTLIADLASDYTNGPAYFYVFENKGTGADNLTAPASTTRFVIEGMWDADGVGTSATPIKTYYSVVINEPAKTDANKSHSTGTDGKYVVRNTKYTLNVTIKAQGVDDPADEPVNATLEVTVTVADWKVLTQTVTFE